MKRSSLPVLSPFSHSFSKTRRRVNPAGDRANLLQFFQVLVPLLKAKVHLIKAALLIVHGILHFGRRLIKWT